MSKIHQSSATSSVVLLLVSDCYVKKMIDKEVKREVTGIYFIQPKTDQTEKQMHVLLMKKGKVFSIESFLELEKTHEPHLFPFYQLHI